MNYTVDDNTESKLKFLCVLMVETFPETHLLQGQGIKYYKNQLFTFRESNNTIYMLYTYREKYKLKCVKNLNVIPNKEYECLLLFHLFH